MTRAEEYRALAKDVRARAANEADLRIKTEWENLALMYVHLAKQANSAIEDDLLLDLVAAR